MSKKPPKKPASVEPPVNGRAPDGTFGPGNGFGKNGSPHAAKVAAWRAEFVAAVIDGDVKAVVVKLVAAAKSGEQWAVKELLSRTIGDPATADLDERISQLEQAIAAREKK